MATRKKSTGGIAKLPNGKRRRVGSEFTRVVKQGPNKGDTVRYRVAPGGKQYAVAVIRDRGNNSTLKGSGIRFGGKSKSRAKRRR